MASRTSSAKEKKPFSKRLWDFMAGNNTILPIPKFARMIVDYHDTQEEFKKSLIRIAYYENRLNEGSKILSELECCTDPIRARQLQKQFDALHN